MSVRTLSFLVVVALVAHSSDLNAQNISADCARIPEHPAAAARSAAGVRDDGDGDRGGAAPGPRSAARKIPAPVQTASGPGPRAQRRARSLGLPDAPLQRRLRQRDSEQPVSARHQLSRLHGVAAPRHAAGLSSVHGRRPPQPAVRRRRQLGSDPASRHLVDDGDARVQSAVRAQHARRRARDPDEGRFDDARHDRAGHLRQRCSPRRSSSSTAAAGRTAFTGISPAICSARMGGARLHRRTFASCSASSGGSVASYEWSVEAGHANNSLNGNGLRRSASSIATTPAYTKPDTTDNRSTFLNVTARRNVRATLSISGNVCYRDIHTNTINGDLNEASLDQAHLPADAGRTGARWPQPAIPASRRAAPTPPTRRSRRGGASPTCCSTTQPAERCNGLIEPQPNVAAQRRCVSDS